MKKIFWAEEKFILSFPHPSTGKFHRPQLLHKAGRVLYCGAKQSTGKWVTAKNAGVPEPAE
jgi:hypothetical protein